MRHAVTTDPTRDPPSPQAHRRALEQQTRRRSAPAEAAKDATRASRQGQLQWAGAAAAEFPPGFVEFAEARARGISVACADPSGA